MFIDLRTYELELRHDTFAKRHLDSGTLHGHQRYSETDKIAPPIKAGDEFLPHRIQTNLGSPNCTNKGAGLKFLLILQWPPLEEQSIKSEHV